MKNNFRNMIVASLMLALIACGNVSHRVAVDGGSANELVWPSPDSTTPMHKGGTFPNLDNLQLVRAGLNKQQVSDLIGYPHFSEGVWGVREWNFLFNFRKPDTDEVTVCQFKVLFDDGKLARSFYWKPEFCAALLETKVPVVAAPRAPAVQKRVLSADALFPFDKASTNELTPAGRRSLNDLAGELRGEKPRSVLVIGYTDRLGSPVYNHELSLRRANTVRDYLVDAGIPASSIRVEGRGGDDPVTECPVSERKQLIACLALNRRVEVKTGSGD